METSYTKYEDSEQVKLSMEGQIHTAGMRGLHIPKVIQQKGPLIICAIVSFGFVLGIALLSKSLQNSSEMSKEINLMKTTLSQKLFNVSKEVFGTSLKIVLYQTESRKELSHLQEAVVSLMAKENSTLSVLQELAELKRGNGRLAGDVIPVLQELHNFTVSLMAKENSTLSMLEELAELKRENGRIARDMISVLEELHNFTASLMSKENLTLSVLQELAELNRDVIPALEELHNFTGVLMTNLAPSVLEELAELKRKNKIIARDVQQVLEELHNVTDLFCSSCPDNWWPFGKSCYFFSTSRKPWMSAKQFCENEGAHLVIINSMAEHNVLTGQLSRDQVFWIGLSDIVNEGKWYWIDGTPMTFSLWAPGEPNNVGHGGEDCATLRFNGKWNDATCSSNEFWICEQNC
ncbi:C-type lectin domain family 4 member G-like [Hemicordylus capensis]|uniref:C-type lectin domain family 4 member G-like n=1 Tax=Hemicordylus capensis TaxID=884348 RepID=UPI0023036B7D|nr:C-type lectin domain family 4 member G-like [Hemicordylus capensis]